MRKIYTILAAFVLLSQLATAADFTVINLNDAGPGSLRQAILSANAAGGADNIFFAIPGGGPHVIKPSSPLPVITGTTAIDGYSQSGSIKPGGTAG